MDIAQYLQPVEMMELRGEKGVAVDSVDASFMIWLELDAQIEPFNNAKVRQAMNFAFPQEQVLKTVLQGIGSPLNGCMPNISPGLRTSSGTTNTIPIGPRRCWRKVARVPVPDEPRLQCGRSGAGADCDPVTDRVARRGRGARTEEDTAGDVLQRSVGAQAADHLLCG